jgi:hypothetical protein
MTKHTPGPWVVHLTTYPDGDPSIHVGTPGALAVTPQYVAQVCSWGGPCAEQDANASLIAAAPDLLAACEELVSEFEGQEEDENGDLSRPDTYGLQLARTAIKLAHEGRP